MLFDSGFGRHHTCWSVSFSRQRSILGRYSSPKRRRASAMKDSETLTPLESACGVVIAKTYRHLIDGVNVRLKQIHPKNDSRRSDYTNTLTIFRIGLVSLFSLGSSRTRLGFVAPRVVPQHQFNGVGSFCAALLLQFINPIGHGFDHFARGLRGRSSLRRGLLLSRQLALFDDFDSFLF